MSTETPRTDAEIQAVIERIEKNQDYGYAEEDAWDFARKLEIELESTRKHAGIALDLIRTVNGEVDTFCLPVAIKELTCISELF